MVALLMFIKPVSRRRFTRPPYNNDDDDDGGLGINLDDIILPPIDGITYPSQIKERELV